MTQNEEYQSGGMKQWLQDNLRILISVFIVILIAGGIYSYSLREESRDNELAQEENILDEITGEEEEQTPEEEKEIVQEEKQSDQKQQEQKAPEQNKISSSATSQETENSFIEAAQEGDGTTQLARRALDHNLEKNPDSTLTKEHKIYIEDYLRKNVSFNGQVHIGTSVEFQKSLINDAIAKSKTLNENQLRNLQKYSARVSSLT